MRILFLSSIYPHPSKPESGTFNYELCRALSEIHDVRVVAPRPWLECLQSRGPTANRQRPTREPNEVDVTYPPYFYTPKILRSHYGSFMWRSVRKHIWRVLKHFKADCVVSYWAHPDGEVGMLAGRHAGIPAAVIVGGSDVLVLPESVSRRNRVQNVLCKSDAIVTVSEGLRRKVIELGTLPERAHTVYQGVDVTKFCRGGRQVARQKLGIAADQTTLLWVGRMVPIKGLDTMLESVSRMKDRGVEFRLHLVGDGPLRHALQQKVAARGLSAYVRIAGAVRHAELPDWYRAANVTVLSSRSEGLPNVLRETLACGTPFVSTDVGSISEIASDKYSRLVPAGDAVALADALVTVIHDVDPSDVRPTDSRSWGDCAAALSDVLAQMGRRRSKAQSSASAPRLTANLTEAIAT